MATVVFCRKIHSILFLWWGSCFLGYIPPLCSDLCGTDRNQGIFRYRYRVCKSLTIFCRRTFVCIKPGVRVTNWHISRKKVYRFLSLVREGPLSHDFVAPEKHEWLVNAGWRGLHPCCYKIWEGKFVVSDRLAGLNREIFRKRLSCTFFRL